MNIRRPRGHSALWYKSSESSTCLEKLIQNGVSLIAGMEYGMEQWNGIWNGNQN